MYLIGCVNNDVSLRLSERPRFLHAWSLEPRFAILGMTMTKKERVKRSPMLREETLQGIFAVLFFAAGMVLTFAAVGKAGVAGETLYRVLTRSVGVGFYLLPLLSFFLCIGFLRALRGLFPLRKTAGALVLFLSGLGIIQLTFPTRGGLVGAFLGKSLAQVFEVYTSLVILGAVFVIAVLIFFEAAIPLPSLSHWRGLFRRRREPRITGIAEKEAPEEAPEEVVSEDVSAPRGEEREETRQRKTAAEEPSAREKRGRLRFARYAPPSLALLEGDHGKPGVGDIKANANIIKRTLLNFGIEVEMDEVSIGPSVTRYALKPAESVRLSKIVALQRELELALAAHPIRIEAPIPGKSLVGIEIPNTTKAVVGLATMLGSPEFVSSEKPLLVSLGRDLSGRAHFANLGKMPHLLIAGATGAGKSVTIHTIITSLLFRNSPDDLKFILIDPKRVELTLYNRIPHLLTPVITDAKKAILALKWAAKEMDRRYDILESEAARDIHSYRKNVLEPELKKLAGTQAKETVQEAKLPERLPYILIVIDELADIMATYPRELEAAVVRLAQMSRATGIHLVLSTQRPSVNVITGLIKANIPARIALQVASQVDSRTILDAGGAEKLLGAGDMLFLSGEMSKPARLQSAFISESEVKKVTGYLAKTYQDEAPGELALPGGENTEPLFADGSPEEEIDDDLYEDALEAVRKAGKASTSYLQRKLRIGYARAARIMDILEERGVIGPADGSKPRAVLGAAGHDAPPPEEDEGTPGPGQL